MTYYLQDNPNPNTGQYGWPRTRVSGVIGVHTTESGVIPSGPDGGAENTAAFIARRTDYGSYHTLADADSRIKLVHPSYAAWADTTNNAHAMSVSGAMDAARWRDLSPDRAAAIVRNMGIAAAELVQDAIAAGLLNAPPPAVRITAAEAIAGTRPGFYGHGETNPGTRYDPGQNFDWGLFLTTYANAIGGGIAAQGTTITEAEQPKEWDEMASKAEIFEAVWGGPGVPMIYNNELDRNEYPRTTLGAMTDRIVRQQIVPLRQEVAAQAAQVASLIGAVAAVSKGEPFDQEKLLAGVRSAAEAGVKSAIESIDTTVTLKG